MNWEPFNSGETIGTLGSEGGITLLDDEHLSGARITLERGGGIAPFAITCGIYGCFFHTTFLSSEVEGREKFDKMKGRLDALINFPGTNDDFYEEIHRFVNDFQ